MFTSIKCELLIQVTGTEADLRKLSMVDASELLKHYGVSDEVIDKLKRWDRIGMIRKLSTQAAVAGERGRDTITARIYGGFTQ